ncbi:phosphatases II [Rhizoclosmatium globosum]|uniref:protein-tyrosine-phosphatase n=1 Tax=Rhizoclosmatium globosum TaxID=329046 RepID=A0A1Y2BPN6_9FUNG|nr:phosphatases II [Rhizoclosmatium globosum]|eukprot:ORY36718.1 phosphatases II [Rhizoclosmatium globosum]
MPYATLKMNHNQSSAFEPINHGREFIKDRLYYTWVSQAPQQTQNVHYFTIDNTLIYINFYSDFGPNSLAHVIRFCEMMREKFNNPSLKTKKICLYSSSESDKRANALVGPEEKARRSISPLVGINPPFLPYRDAGYGLYKALNMGLLHIENLDSAEYEFYEKVEHGDLNWITDKFIAMACPKDDVPNAGNPYVYGGYVPGVKAPGSVKKPYQPAYRMDDLIRLLKERGTTTVVRLNNKTYEKRKFCEAGLEHVELFLDLCESTPGVIAVHCKAGLGRTGTLIACYLMKHYKFTASEVIGLLRVLRPGSVVGPQQNYLQSHRLTPRNLNAKTTNIPHIPTLPRFRSNRRITINDIIRNLERSRLTPHTTKSRSSDLMVVDNDDDLEADLGSITMEDADGYDLVTQPYYTVQETPVTLATAALNMTTMDAEAPLEYAEGGGGIYAGYAVPVQPRKQIAATKREVVGGSVPNAGFSKNYHPATSTDQWRNATPLPQTSRTPEPSMGHPHTVSQSSATSSKTNNYMYTSKPSTASSQYSQPRYNLRASNTSSVAQSRPGSQMQPRAVSRAETPATESLMISGKNVERARVVPTPGMSYEETLMEQQKQGQKLTSHSRRG